MALSTAIHGTFEGAASAAWKTRRGTVISLRTLGRRLFSRGSDRPGRLERNQRGQDSLEKSKGSGLVDLLLRTDTTLVFPLGDSFRCHDHREPEEIKKSKGSEKSKGSGLVDLLLRTDTTLVFPLGDSFRCHDHREPMKPADFTTP